jgi:hypothetical protein
LPRPRLLFYPLYRGSGPKGILVYPFSLNPEGSNPAGPVNFSKVSPAKLTIDVDPIPNADCTIDVYAVYYNWLQIKDGRALTSFA